MTARGTVLAARAGIARPRALALLGGAALLWIVLAGLVGAAPAAQPAPADALLDIRANQDPTADQHEPSLAVDPTNPDNVLAAAKDWRTGPKQVWHYRSTDGGRTWIDGYANLTPVELPNQSDPVVALDADGRAYMAVLGYNQNDLSVGGVFVSRSDDKGATWGKATLVQANSDKVFHDKEWMTVDRSNNAATRGTVYVSWTRFTQVTPRSEVGQIVVSRSTDLGATFSAPVAVSTEAQENVQGSFPVVGPDGAVTVLYYDSASAAHGEGAEGSNLRLQESGGSLYVARSTDRGSSFRTPVSVAPVVRPPSPLPSTAFRIFVLPVLAVDPSSGALYAVWNDYSRGNSDVMLSSSRDGGANWTGPVRVNDDTGQADQFFPTAAVGAGGALHVMWLDRRSDPANVKYLPYYAVSTDGGNSFSPNVPLTAVSSDPATGFEGTLIGDYNAIDITRDGSRVYTAWVDTRRGDQDIFFAAFPAGSQAPLVPAAATPQPTAIPLAVPSPQPLTGFVDRAFIQQWERADRPVVRGQVQRPWLWGPVSFSAAVEEYSQGPGGQREVQYFDKARMEINSPSADRNSPGYVTNGLLVVELISGRIQLGDANFAPPLEPSAAPVAGDANSPDALTYASLRSVASLAGDNRAPDRTGQGVTALLDRSGRVTDDPNRAGAVRLVHYEPVLGHNIPDVFWQFMNARGLVYSTRFGTLDEAPVLDWLQDLGYPITEPYWTAATVAGNQRNVLVQAFQRRVLTYVAENNAGWQVEMGNVGRHYFDWRYGRLGQPARR